MVGVLSFRARKDGTFRASWFEDDSLLEEASAADLWLTRSVAANWPAFRFTSMKPTPVLFNPLAMAFSEEVRDTVGEIEGVEYLPILVNESQRYFIVHVIQAIELPEGSDVHPGPHEVMTVIRSFPRSFHGPPGLFRILQPKGTLPRSLGIAMKKFYAGEETQKRIVSAAGEYLFFRSMQG